jgi:hypothetical protein
MTENGARVWRRRGVSAEAIGVNWSRFDLEQFRAGMDVEFEHGAHDPQTDVTGGRSDHHRQDRAGAPEGFSGQLRAPV